MKKSGFTLIEIMVAVAILSVIASLWVPHYLEQKIEKKRQECHFQLKNFFQAQQRYFQTHQSYASNLQSLERPFNGTHFQFTLLPPHSQGGFLIECSGNIDRDATLDRASIDETGVITQLVDDLRY